MSDISAPKMMSNMPSQGAVPSPGGGTPAPLPQAAAQAPVPPEIMKQASPEGDSLSFGSAGEEAARESVSFAESQQASVFELDAPQGHAEPEAPGRDRGSDEGSGDQQGDSQGGSQNSAFVFDIEDFRGNSEFEKDSPSSEQESPDTNTSGSDNTKESFGDLVENGNYNDIGPALAGGAWITAAPMQLQMPVAKTNVPPSRDYDAKAQGPCTSTLCRPRRQKSQSASFLPVQSRRRTRTWLILLLIGALVISCISYYRSTPILRSRHAQETLNSLMLQRDAAARQMTDRFKKIKDQIRDMPRRDQEASLKTHDKKKNLSEEQQ